MSLMADRRKVRGIFKVMLNRHGHRQFRTWLGAIEDGGMEAPKVGAIWREEVLRLGHLELKLYRRKLYSFGVKEAFRNRRKYEARNSVS